MADDEQFSLCWNNFNTNLSAGFHESLCRGDLVDVTLAAEGQLVKAHRLVLSVCSPYFRKMFTQMPANQQAFVFLKDVSAAALKDLIQFMYCGEVNVKQEALPAFISTAEALQIKGLTESNDAQTASTSNTQTAKEMVTSTPTPVRSPRARIVTSRAQPTIQQQSFKLDTDGSEDKLSQTVQIQQQPLQQQSVKRVAQRQVVATAPKRIKVQQTSVVQHEQPDPLDASEIESMTPQEIKTSDTSEFVDMPIESSQLSTKPEPDYGDDIQETENVDQDDEGHYVEDESYGGGEAKYEESYFTEGDDTKAGVSGFMDSYSREDQTDAQEYQVVEYNENDHRANEVIVTESTSNIIVGPNMIPIHPKSNVYVDKDDILKIFTDKPALYSVRLAELVFGVQNLTYSRLPDDNTSSHPPLNPAVLDSIITHVCQIFKKQSKLISRSQVKTFIKNRIKKLQQNNV